MTKRLRDAALAAIAQRSVGGGAPATAEEDLLLQRINADVIATATTDVRSLNDAVTSFLEEPAPEDARLVAISKHLHLSRPELLAVALAAAVEDDPLIGRILAHVQSPVGGARPTIGLLSSTLAPFRSETPVLPSLINGSALKSGLLSLLNESAPLPERPVVVSPALCLALSGYDSAWPGASVGLAESARTPLHETTLVEARRHANALKGSNHRTLVLRTGSPAEGRSTALVIAETLDLQPAFIEGDKFSGLGPWLVLQNLLPVFVYDLAPGERRSLPEISGYEGPMLAVCGPDGSIENRHGTAANWIMPTPSGLERQELWKAALGKPLEGTEAEAAALIEDLSQQHRHGAGRIAHLGRLAHHHAAVYGRRKPNKDDILAAAWTGEGGGLDSLAEPLRTQIPDKAFVSTPRLEADLESMMQRCLARENLAAGLGASAKTRYRPGVRALFTGASGTGKTLAAGWIATRLGLPLYRVDLASVTSKYIGETEKNLSQLLSRAENAEIMLLFDEADSLFGKRTEIGDANDRFANAQTNYLLQRIEHYDGIVVLTSNSQARFDEAFSRRLDFIVDFPDPGPEERRSLWISHLGDIKLPPQELNRLAVLVDLSGGHIRNAVLAAAVVARHAKRDIQFQDLVHGAKTELRKLGRQVPLELLRR